MLQNVTLLQDLTADEMKYLAGHSTVREYAPGTIIFVEGSAGDSFSVVLEGELDVIKAHDSDGERLVNRLEAGDFLGELSLVHRDHHRSATVRARSAAKLLDIPLQVFESLVKRNAHLAFTLMQLMSQRMTETENATILDLRDKNRQLAQSLMELRAAEEQLIIKEKMEFELNMAHGIQESMLPKEVPVFEGWRIHAHWQPAHSVSGDFYDFLPLPDGRTLIAVGDVTGKGVPAALLMMMTRSILHAAALQARTPQELLEQVNVLLCPDIPDNMFVTCHVSFFDPATGTIDFANAGHCLPVLCHDGEISELKAAGLPLGLMDDVNYIGGSVQVMPGDRLIYYSDGLTEAHSPDGKMLGKPVLFEALRAAGGPGSRHDLTCAIITYLLERWKQHAGPGAEQEDDITLVYVERML